MDEQPAADDHRSSAADPARSVIELAGVSRSYRMGAYLVHALKAIDLRIDAGEFVAIIGPSGSGKSTLMYLLGCLDRPDAGCYRLDGDDVATLDDQALSRLRNRAIGYVFQQFHLLGELDVIDNVALGLCYAGQERAQRRERAAEIASRMGLHDRLTHTPNELSGGQMQRVAIARALAGEPALLLADEPTGNLDSQTGLEIMEVFHRLHEAGTTIVLITHDRDIAAQAERVVERVDGEIVSDSRTRERSAPVSAEPASAAAPAPAETAADRLRFPDLMRMALREGLFAHKLRSLLTTLGIVFGIAAVISMTAITEGGKRQQLEQIRQIGLNNIQIHDLGLEGARLLRQRRVNPHGVTRQDLQLLLGNIPEIADATAWKQLRAELRYQDRVLEDARPLGVTGAFQEVVNYHVARGRFLDADDAERFARVCVLGPELVDELGIADPLGALVIIGDQPFTVVGVMERKPFADSEISDVDIVNRNRDCYLPLASLRSFFARDSKASELDTISLRMRDDAGLVAQSKLIRHIIAAAHDGAEDFGVSVPLEKLRQAQATKEVFNVIIVVIAAISLLVGGIGIMNIMLANVTERTREIGIRRAIGASRAHVLRQFLAEALLIAALGGLAGILLGVGGAALVELVFGFPTAINVGIVVISVLVSVAIGVGFGIYPAYMAARMDPVEALRN